MSYQTIISLLFLFFFQNVVFAQLDTTENFKKFQNSVDSLVENAIEQRAFPGCTVLGVYKGSPIFFKSYGYHTYDSLEHNENADIYDLASVTKVMASTMAIMKLYDDQLIDLDMPISKYVSGLGHSKFGQVTVRECMAHQGGLRSWIPYYQEIKRKDGSYPRKTIASEQSEDYPYELSKGLYLHKDFYEKIKKMIRKSKVQEDPHYVYSDLSFYLTPELVERLSGMPFVQYLDQHFYQPMELSTVTFNPSEKFDLQRIVPTEIDSYFRNEPIHGRVHDEGAIMMRGVSGHAGLFSDAQDLAALGQMLEQFGTYKGVQYLKPSTIDLFTTYQYANKNNRRALGFDKPLLEYNAKDNYIARSASVSSFGHSGFTGTFVWIDPEKDFVFVFLSNRVYPTRDSRMLYDLSLRPTLHQVFYDYITDSLEK